MEPGETYNFKQVSEAVWELPKEGTMNVPVRVFATKPLLGKMQRDRTLRQAKNVASLPGILEAAMVMPDGHEGYGFPIGGVAVFDLEQGVVSPGGVGYDINCGVRLLRTNLTEKDVRPKLKELTHKMYDNVPSGVGSKSKLRLNDNELEQAVTLGARYFVERGIGVDDDLEHCEENGQKDGAVFSKISDKARKRGKPQFGTLGSGNHFAEIQKVEKIYNEEAAKAFGLDQEGQVTVMLHTGSRGFGHQVCEDNIRVMLNAARKYGINLPDPELCCAPVKSPEAQDYFGAMNCAVNFAFGNRHCIGQWVRDTFAQVLGKSWDSFGMQTVYDVCHNIAKIEEHEVNGAKRKVCVHRKGATRAFWAGRKEVPQAYRSVGQPVLIPGSMSTASYVLVGTETGKVTFGSSCHGAGRVMSRHQALREFNGKQLQDEMLSAGIQVRAPTPRSLAEEAGGAYKDVDEVVQSVSKAGISNLVCRLVPLGVIKG